MKKGVLEMYKKILSFILAMLCIMSCAVVGVSAAGNGTPVMEGNFKAVYYSDGTAMLYEASVDEAHVVIPETVGGYVITEISNAFANNKKIKSVTIPDTVTGVLGSAFRNCTNLESVTVYATTPPSLGNWPFDDTNDCPIYVPSGSVNTYKSAWPGYASRIQSIP